MSEPQPLHSKPKTYNRRLSDVDLHESDLVMRNTVRLEKLTADVEYLNGEVKEFKSDTKGSLDKLDKRLWSIIFFSATTLVTVITSIFLK